MNYKKKKYNVISLHFTTDCNLDCPFCYRPKKTKNNKEHKWFIELIPYLSKLTNQIAIGGGEPFMHPEFIKEFSKVAKDYNLITNVTTNGTLPMRKYIDNVEMVSVSLDKYKYGLGLDSLNKFIKNIKQLKNKTRIGCNLLMDNYYVDNPIVFIKLLDKLFKNVERVFALYPKNWKFIDILKARPIYLLPTLKYKHFYVDDLTNKIIVENKYNNWNKPCHFGKSLISIDERGYIYGCSFSNTPILKLDNPKDLMKVKNIKLKERYSCPYLKIQN